MDKQEIFDTVVTHLFTQRKQAMDKRTDACVYRARGGLKCAVGCLIPDKLYHRCLEGMTPSQMASSDPTSFSNDPSSMRQRAKYAPPVAALLGETNISLLDALQSAHDYEANWDAPHHTAQDLTPMRERGASALWESLLGIAREYKLKQKVLRKYRHTTVTPAWS